MRAQEDRLTADSAVGAASRAGVPAALPATGPGSDYAQLSRTVKRAGLLRRRPVYYSLKIGLNLVLLQIGRDPDIGGRAISFTPGQIQARRRLGAWLGRYQARLFFPMLLLEGLHLHIASVRALLGRSGKAR
jgi:hypothetical protein